jgi:hypothetical protein
MGIVIVVIIIIMFLFGLHELRSFALWAFTEHETDDDEHEHEPEYDTRKIFGNGFVYHSPIENELENDVFEWTVERFRVEGETLEKDENFGKNIF